MTLITADAFVTADSICVLADGSILIITADSLETADQDMFTADGAMVCIYGSASVGPSRSQKEQKKASYRDRSIDWSTSFDQQIKDKKKEIKEVKKQIKVVKETKKKVSSINFPYFEEELAELYQVLDDLMRELDSLKDVKVSLKGVSRKKAKEVFEEVDDFEDILFILKFVLKRI